MLSLLKGTKIRVVALGSTELREVQDLGPTATCYDTYGDPFVIDITPGPEERCVLVMAQHGEAAVFGESHQILCRNSNEPLWRRRPLMDTNADVFVRLPQKKITATRDMFAALDYDENGMFFTAETVKDLLTLMEATSTLGVTVNRHNTQRRVEVSQRRPVCFANKLINGNFNIALEDTLASLAASGVIQPWRLYGPEFIEETKRTGVIFEGNCVYNDLPLLPPKIIERKFPTWHVKAHNKEDEQKPVELVWFQS